MKLNRLVAGATIAGSLGAAALGMGTGLANAAPTPLPAASNHDVSAPIDYHGPGRPGGPAPWHGDSHRGDFNGAPWGNGPAPWGWGAPPRPAWGGPLPPPGAPWAGGPINYWGYQETPVWNLGFNQWGFDFFGVWIPL
jgi:hypothetical protein